MERTQKISQHFETLKAIEHYDELFHNAIRLREKVGYLVPIARLHQYDENIITLLTKWRSEAKTFHTTFKASNKRTEIWLRKSLLEVPDRILFLVINRFGVPIGHMGFADSLNKEGTLELDNVIRGVKRQDPGLMTQATISLLEWAKQNFQPKGFKLRTLDDNEHAIQFYYKIGFRIHSKQGLRRIQRESEITHLPIHEDDHATPDKWFLVMHNPGI